MFECHIRPIHLLFNRHCFILSDCVSRRVTRTGIRRKKIPENAFGACGNDLFVLYLHPQTAPRELSSAGSERLPYKQRVGGSNPSAPTTPTINDLRKRESFFVGMLRCPLCCRRSGPRSCGETCRADEKKADRYAIRLAGFHVPPPHGAQCATWCYLRLFRHSVTFFSMRCRMACVSAASALANCSPVICS